MMWKPVAAVACSLASLTAATPAWATNRGFFPGDAFFHTTLTKEVAEKLRADASTPLRYATPDHEEGGFCGYTGYWNARLPADSPLAARLADLYDRLRRDVVFREVSQAIEDDGTVTEWETNGFNLFLYNSDYNPRRRGIGLRYNETWVEDEMAFGPSRAGTRLEIFVDHPHAVSQDWRDAADVPPLNADCPPLPPVPAREVLRMAGPMIEEPIRLRGPVLAVVTEQRDLNGYFRPRRSLDPFEIELEIGETYYVVTTDGVTRHYFNRKTRRWQSDNWPTFEEIEAAERAADEAAGDQYEEGAPAADAWGDAP
ncbi:hypothetical protein [Alienimonas californiensis]|uniref:Uncharacterized protein n=1 Tax=Alienimonas californiensis TaxID=2527989 RepID=A0A517P620_9PLAN|nr:hypothetical protein [Alienimonas californiensis]QDT14824.1 hypothetical protein CA12_09040 [Alienimonas californiensis]